MSDLESFEVISQDRETRDVILRLAGLARGGRLGTFIAAVGADPKLDDETRAWALDIAESLRTAHPRLVTTESAIAGRETLVLIDYAQNALGKTTVAPYSVRPRPGAPVSMPLTWEEVAGMAVRPGDFTIRTAPQRLAERGDLFAPVLAGTGVLARSP